MDAKIAAQGVKVRDLKKAKAPKDEIKAAVAELLALKAEAGIDPKANSNQNRGQSQKAAPAAAAGGNEFEAQITAAGAKVRDLKKAKAPVDDIKAAVAELLVLKAKAGIDAKAGSNSSKGAKGNKASKSVAVPTKPSSLPANVKHRMDVWDQCRARRAEDSKPSLTPITITLPDGKTVEGKAGETTPLSIAQSISKQMAAKMVISKVNGVVHDLQRPLTEDCSLELLDFNTPDGTSKLTTD